MERPLHLKNEEFRITREHIGIGILVLRCEEWKLLSDVFRGDEVVHVRRKLLDKNDKVISSVDSTIKLDKFLYLSNNAYIKKTLVRSIYY